MKNVGVLIFYAGRIIIYAYNHERDPYAVPSASGAFSF